MEWVETTAASIEAAKEQALDELGVDEQEAEFEVLEEPKPGLFGRMRGEARVRARVQPRTPRPKVERRRRRGGGRQAEQRERAPARSPGQDQEQAPSRGRTDDHTPAAAAEPPPPEEDTVSDDAMTAEEQAERAGEFLVGLAEAFGHQAEARIEPITDDLVEVHLDGDELGLMIGPKGTTLQAIYDLAKVVVQREADGQRSGRFRIDIGGYRARRREALERFATQVADQVRESGTATALEPMGASDRKTVHDTVNEIDGVSTRSEGEEPRRRVVIEPDEG